MIIELSDMLLKQSQPLLALIDSVRVPEIEGLITRIFEGPEPPDVVSLFDEDGLGEVAPRLLSVPASESLLRTFLRECWGRSAIVLLTSDSRFKEIADHLSGLTKVQTENGEIMYFRFYDPRVLRVFIPTCTPTERAEFFGPIHTFWAEAEDSGQALELRFDNSNPKVVQLGRVRPAL